MVNALRIDVLGMQEFADTAAGYRALDAIIKAAPVEIVRVSTVNPGKLVVFFTGDLASVEAAQRAGERSAGKILIDRLLIPNVHRSVSDALAGKSDEVAWDAVGVVDVGTVTAGVEAADRAAKEADVQIAEIRFDDAMGGRSSVRFSGALNAVEAGMAAIEAFLETRGLLVGRAVIPNPHPELLPTLNLHEGQRP